jgi:hypothetical protein
MILDDNFICHINLNKRIGHKKKNLGPFGSLHFEGIEIYITD